MKSKALKTPYDVVEYKKATLENYNPVVIKSFASKRSAEAWLDREGDRENCTTGHFIGQRISPLQWLCSHSKEVRDFR